MSKIKCNARHCGYNENNECAKQKIQVEGVFAKNKMGTFCESFVNPNIESKAYVEMAKEMFSDGTENHENKVFCSANYCKYNNNSSCTAKEIQIESSFSKYRSETECSSFELK